MKTYSKPGLPPSARSAYMEAAIECWQNILCGAPPWLSPKRPRSLNLAAAGCQYLSRLVCAELQLECSGSAKAQRLNRCIHQELLPRLPQAVQQALGSGSVLFKPYVSGGKLHVECLRSDQFYPVEGKGEGEGEGMVFLSRCRWQGRDYLRSEYHRFEDGLYRISNRAFLCDSSGFPGKEIPLTAVPLWEEGVEEIAIQGLDSPLWSQWKLPFANCVDGSGEPVSLFANGQQCLADLDRIYNDYCYEFESARRKLILREDALRMDQRGRPILPQSEGADDVYLPLDLPGDSSAFGDYTPEIRESQYRQAINQLLRLYELQCGLSSGTFSLDEKGAVTATQVISQDRRTYYSVCEIQQQGKAALEGLLKALSALCDLYELEEGEYRVNLCFGDSIFEDTATEFDRRLKLVQLGMKPELLLAWYFGKDEATARQMLQEKEKEEKESHEE